MKINRNSLSARLYRWFYITDEMPKTLCPYFWKLVIMYMLILPVGIINLPLIIFNENDEFDNWGERFGIGVLCYAFLFLIGTTLFSIVTLPIWGLFKNEFYKQLQVIGIMGLVIAIAVFIGILMVNLITKIKDKKRYKRMGYTLDEDGNWVRSDMVVKNQGNIITEFIKAKYNKYCPKIDWE